MPVRLWTANHTPLGEIETRTPRLVQRTLRHRGILYELIGEDAGGVRDYRATEALHPRPPRTAGLIDVGGNACGTVPIPADAVPPVVMVDGVRCPLWTSRDPSGQPVYLKAADGA